MKKLILIIIGFLFIASAAFSQNVFKYRINAISGIQIGDSVSGSNIQKIDSAIISNDTIYFYSQGVRLAGTGGGGSMTYPDAGIALSTGAAWGSSIANNSANWNTAYGWGDHSTQGYLEDGDFGSNGLLSRTGAGSYSIVSDNSTNWNTAYTDRLKWDGGATGLVAATGRTSLGGTTIGQNIFTLTNPSAVTFPRFNADNTITARSAAELKTDLSLNNVTNESKATMFSSPTFTTQITIGDDVITEGDAELLKTISGTDVQTQINAKADISNESHTGNTSIADLTVAKLNVGVTGGDMVELDSITSDVSSNLYFYDGADTLNPYVPYSARSTDEPLLIDDVRPMYSYTIGYNNVNDTLFFNVDSVLFGTQIGGGYSLVIDSVTAVVQGSSPDVDINLYYDDNYRDAGATEVLTSDLTVTSTTSGDSSTGMTNGTVAAGKWFWATIKEATAKPRQLIINIFGHLE
jgi:hypothetical protein